MIFVYNAQSGFRNALMDTAHKLLSPSTYECRLCEMTFGLTGERRGWKKFREQSPVPFKFLHKDEFLTTYASKFQPKYTFPIVLGDTGEDLEVLISTADLNSMQGAEDLIRAVQARTGS